MIASRRSRILPALPCAVLLLACAGAWAADPPPDQAQAAERARAAGLAAQKAALAAFKAAEDAIAATDSTARQAAVQRALKAAADANEAAASAQQASTGTGATPAKADEAPTPLATARVSGVIKAGQADDTASIKLSWESGAMRGSTVSSLTFSAPTSSGSDPTRLGTLDGLADAASIKVAQTFGFLADPARLDGPFWRIGWSAKVGKKDYTYVDPAAWKVAEESKTPLAAALFGGYTPTDRLMLLAKVELQKKYADNDEQVLCRVTAAAAIECLSGAVGTPKRTSPRIFSTGVRYIGNGFRLAPTLNYDRATRVRGVDLPVYLLGANDGKPSRLSGGIGASWRSDTRDTAFYVFVGSDFSFWDM